MPLFYVWLISVQVVLHVIVLHFVVLHVVLVHVGRSSCMCSSCGVFHVGWSSRGLFFMWFLFMRVVLPVNGVRVVVLCGCYLCAVVLRTVVLRFFVLGPRGSFIVIARASAICRVIYFSVSMTLGVYVHVHGVHRGETHVNKNTEKTTFLDNSIHTRTRNNIILKEKHA